MSVDNHYCTLGVSPSASSEEIKSAYRHRAREAHPDCRGSAEQFRAVQAAYILLIDPAKRARYDAARRAWMAQIHAVECTACGHANRLTRLLPEGYIARCWHCKASLAVRPEDVQIAQRQILAQEIARVLDTVGSDLADLAVDGVRSGLGRLRRALGLGRTERGTT
jgi:curved DNA-binding protein CbpA